MWPLSAVLTKFGFDLRRRPEDPAADRDAIRRIVAGEPSALADLYDRLSGSVFSLVLRIVDDWAAAEDIAQDVFTQAWQHASRYNESRGSVAAWLLTMARSRAIDYLRARRARLGPTLDGGLPSDLPDLGSSQEALVLSGEHIARLMQAMSELPLLQRIAIELAYYEGLTHAEIAARLEEPLGTIKTRIRLGLLRLREVFAALGALMAETHDELRELIGVYALGALSADERQRFEVHLETCEVCRAEVRSLQPAVEALAIAVPYREPSARLRARVLEIAGARDVPTKSTAPAASPAVVPAWPVWLAAAASIAAVLLAGYSMRLRSQLDTVEARLRTAEARAAAAETGLLRTREVVAAAQTTVAVLAAPDLARVELEGQPPAANARGRAFWSRSRGLVFTAANLPRLPVGRSYQLWIVTPQAALSAGLLTPNEAGNVTATFETPPDLATPVAMAVTLEPEGGVPAPTGEKYLVGLVAQAGL